MPKTPRIASVDIVRGAVMVLMALDHVRDFVTSSRVRPEDLARGTAASFATRWVTHFCAPTFFLLAGVGIGIALDRGKARAEMSRFLVVRGLWLIFVDLVVTAVGWQFGFTLIPAFAIVIWALGLSMMVTAALIHLPRAAVGAFALALIAFHNLFDGVQPQRLGAFGPWWQILHVPGFPFPGKLFIAYPLIPWVGVMSLGYVLAAAFTWAPGRRRRFLIGTGLVAIALFIALRLPNAYGNPFPWSPQRSAPLTVASFLNVNKYPPSLQFLLMTLGPVFVVLAYAERWRGRVAGWLSVYGRVPLFFYVVHIYLAHLVGVTIALVQGGELRRIPVVTDPGSIPAWYGVSLPGVYVAWAFVVIALYVPCRWFARVKATRREWWLQYL